MTEEQVASQARSAVSLTLDESAGALQVYDTWFRARDPKEPSSRDRWVVSVGEYEVGLEDSTGATVYVSWMFGPNLDDLKQVPKFLPWYRRSDEPVTRLREVASRFGQAGLSEIQEAIIPQPAQDGTVTSRYLYVKLVPKPNGLASGGNSGNFAWFLMDAQSAKVHMYFMETSFKYEDLPPTFVGVETAKRSAAAAGDIGEISGVKGPMYTAMALRARECTADGLAYCSSGTVPVVYLVIGSRSYVYVHVGTGKTLAVVDRNSDTAVALGAVQGANATSAESAIAYGDARRDKSGARLPDRVETVWLAGSIVAVLGGVAWWLGKRRARPDLRGERKG